MNTLDNIFQTLCINAANGLYYTENINWKADLHLSSRVERCLEQIKPDAFFCFDNKPLVLFFENPKDKHTLHGKIWNFNEIPVVIVIENGNVDIFNGFNLLDKENLQRIGGNEKLNDFTYFQLVTGKTWGIYEKELSYKNRVDNKLLDNIRDARTAIISQFPPADNEEAKKLYAKIANALLGKIIFVRYLIDRKVELNFEEKAKVWTNDDLCKLLENPAGTVEFFRYLADREKGFNGDLFPLLQSECAIVPKEAYNILIRLLKSEEIATGQKSLFDLYDFSIIPIEFISNVYEYFIGADNQSEQGAYYTPLFLADYILSETVEKYIAENKSHNCKVLDPACGSGVFLVETLRKLIEQYRLKPAKDIERYKDDIQNIVRNNIFGIDKDESAVQVAIFSIYLTLLDYMGESRDIKNFSFPNLLGTNFFCNDFFDEDAEFNDMLKHKDIAFIVGNPPWFRGKNEKKKTKRDPLYVQYVNNRKRRENAEIAVDIGNKEIAQAFLLRSSDFSYANTKCALISTSKILYNLQSRCFRKYFLHNYLIEKIFELAPVRREVFHRKAVTPACILFFNYAKNQNTDKNIIEHIALKPSRFFSMFKIFSVYRHDIQNVQQDRLKRYDWLWKVLVYGSYLDFNFIKRLKEDYKSIQDSFEENTLIKQGIKRVDGDKKIDVGNIDNYYLLASLLNSKLFAYYVFNTSSTAGIMMEQQINDVERFSFPYIYSDEIIQTARKIEQIKNAGSSMLNETEISALISGMNENIYSVFSVSDVELSLLDYANNVAIPIQMRHKGFEKLLSPCTKEDVVFTDYANLFINRFASNFERIGKKFTVEIWHTQQIVGMFFKAISTSDAEPIVWSDKQNDTNIIFHKIVELGVTKITDQLFVQKDIRGFEKEYFYLFKPNEKRLWHKAIGYLDVFEFVDAILRAGRDKNE